MRQANACVSPRPPLPAVIEAAAHGVPTVATKNGGPVDIMATLHHGVVVDPTDGAAIAEALLKILTNPQTWDSMSTNGTKNIMVRPLRPWRAVLRACGGGRHPAACLPAGRALVRPARAPCGAPLPQAYSWPSHCKKYLESIEMEKRFIKGYKAGPPLPGWQGTPRPGPSHRPLHARATC